MIKVWKDPGVHLGSFFDDQSPSQVKILLWHHYLPGIIIRMCTGSGTNTGFILYELSDSRRQSNNSARTIAIRIDKMIEDLREWQKVICTPIPTEAGSGLNSLLFTSDQ